MKRCETCMAFKSLNLKMDPAKPESPMYGECRARTPVILATFHTPHGCTWQSGWPPTNSGEWCMQYQARIRLEDTKSYGTREA